MRIIYAGIFLTATLVASGEPPSREVEAALRPGSNWVAYATRTLDDLPSVLNRKVDGDLSQFGGLNSRRVKSTGFFQTKKIGDRWWFVDPEGCLFLQKGVTSVNMVSTPGARATLKEKFGDETKWAARTIALLRTNGFNGLGAWSDTERLRTVSSPLVYTRIWNFMSAYGKKRGGTFQKPGHTGYPNDCIFVFDPEFPAFCENYAQQLSASKDDKWLLGHFSDNEMPLPSEALRNYLRLPETDSGFQAAQAWLATRHGAKATASDITTQDEQDFLTFMVERYFKIVSRAIKKADPNHLYLGARFHGSDLGHPEIFRAAGPYVDVMSVNYYRAWTPDAEKLAMWERESGKPFLITEWYAKGVDSGMPNHGGAGWLVKTQRDRGLFYQNFALALLESKSCIGWHWFKYVDNDPDDKKVDPSNRDSNKGIVSNRYEPYLPLLDAMKQLNQRTYALVDYFDKPAKSKSP